MSSKTFCVRRAASIFRANFYVKKMLMLSLPGAGSSFVLFACCLFDDHRLRATLLSRDNRTTRSQSWAIEIPAAAAASGNKLVSVIPGIVLTSKT